MLLGYSQTNTYLEVLFPLLGSYFIGFIVVSLILYTLLIFIKPIEIKKSFSGILILIISVTIFNHFGIGSKCSDFIKAEKMDIGGYKMQKKLATFLEEVLDLDAVEFQIVGDKIMVCFE